MTLFHGSSVAGIRELRPGLSNHGKPYVYLTHSPVLAAIYAHNPLTRPNGFFSYWWGKDGTLCYDEYFENQLEVIYSGQRGYVYTCQGEFPQLEKMPWVYLSESPVDVTEVSEIPDLYAQLLQYEQESLLRVRRWHEASEKQREIWENVVRRSLQGTDVTTESGREYAAFVRKYFPNTEPSDPMRNGGKT